MSSHGFVARLAQYVAAGFTGLVLACFATADPNAPPTQEKPMPSAESGEMVRVIAKARTEGRSSDATKSAVEEVEELAKRLGASSVEPMPGSPLIVIYLPADAVKELEASPRVERVQMDKPERPLPR